MIYFTSNPKGPLACKESEDQRLSLSTSSMETGASRYFPVVVPGCFSMFQQVNPLEAG